MRAAYVWTYLALVAAQIILGNFLNLSPYVVLCFLPAMILCLPARMSLPWVMVTAFITGLAVDFTTHGILGLTASALVLTAFCRNFIISLVFGDEIISRRENISAGKQGLPKMALGILLCSAVFFAAYVWIDAAGTRSFGFNLLRTLLSTLVGTVVSVPAAGLLSKEEGGLWK